MEKRVSSRPGAVMLHPAMADAALRFEDFTANAEAFLRKEIRADVMVDICAVALEFAEDAAYRKSVHKYRFLANVALERYYDAMADALAMLTEFEDAHQHYSMMCSLSLKRWNYARALDYVDRILALSLENGLDARTLEEDRDELEIFLSRILCFSAQEFSLAMTRALGVEGAAAVREYAGVPLQITGRATVLVHPASRVPYLVFQADGYVVRSIYCQMPESELPFIRHVEEGRNATVFGYLLSADSDKILLQPSRLVAAHSSHPLL
ncbi:hypothetical protein LJC23_04570 [Desulfovibrio sp. OttesenSCG-928-I05]|nr:hypothetical protein [Desulfovibrio sp. OttesenSCG-928-I05]